MPMKHFPLQPVWRPLGLVAASALLMLSSGCTSLMTSTNRAVDVTKATAKGTTHASKATTDALITEPDTPRYAEAEEFVRSQRAQLARQAATGGGEDIDALASLLGRQDSRPMGRWMQRHYRSLFSDRSVSASTIVSRIDAQTS